MRGTPGRARALAVALALWLIACARREAPAPRPVVLVTIDTLRADRLGVYGYPKPTSPTIDALAAEGTVFDTAVPSCPATAPSMATLLTGHYRASHGVRHNAAAMPAEVETLAEMLRARGWRTVGRVANPLLEARYGFGQGFDDYGLPTGLRGAGPQMHEGTPLVREAEQLIDGLPADGLFFLWLHFHDPHGPYFPPAAYQAMFPAEDYRWKSDRELSPSSINYGLRILPHYQVIPESFTPAAYRARYDGEIRFMDDHVRAIVRKLTARGLWDRVLFVFAADHGEGLGEHDYYFQHGWFTYDDCLHVPLFLRAPGLVPAGRRVAPSVSLVDVAPTILELVGIAPPAGMEGRSLVPLLDGGGEDRPAFAQTYYGNERVALRLGSFKYIYTPPLPPGAPAPVAWQEPIAPREARHELYDLASDPKELRNLVGRGLSVEAELRRRMTEWLDEQRARRDTLTRQMAARGNAKPEETLVPDAAAERVLRSLGYVN